MTHPAVMPADGRTQDGGAVTRRFAIYLTLGIALVAGVVAVVAVQRPGAEAPEAAASTTTPQLVATSPAPAASSEPAAPPEAEEPAPLLIVSEQIDPLDSTDFDVLDPVSLDDEADFGTGVTAVLLDVAKVEAEARGPGEVVGPGLAVTVRITNDSGGEISLDEVVVDLYAADGSPSTISFGDERTSEFSGALAAGTSAEATYVARVANSSGEITVTVSYEPGNPAVSFVGKA